jgi:mannose-1-phosphate guanylyltransferase
MVLAAGLGTRLRPLTDVRPKSLVPVGDRPALDHVLARLRAAGVERVVVNAHHHAGPLQAHAAVMPGVSVSVEAELLGTAGGIQRAGALLGDGDVVVWNGDILADVDVAALLGAHRDAATLVVQPLPAGQGSVGVDAEGRVVRLRTERFGEEAHGGQFLGIQVIGAALRARLPPSGGLVEDLYLPAMARGETLRARWFEGPWSDIGTVASYVAANVAWLEARGERAWVGPGARVGTGVGLERSVVGASAFVEGTGTLARCVVWPGAHATAPAEGVVFTA